MNELSISVYFVVSLCKQGEADGNVVRRGEWKLFSQGNNPKNTTNVELREGNTREGQEET